MKAAALIIVVLSHQGYWFGGHEVDITARWAAKGELPAADFSWDLMFGQLKLASGKVALNAGDKPATVKLTLPEVRTRVALRLAYRVNQRDGGAELEKGDLPVQLFPDDLLADLPDLLRGSRVAVVDHPDGLPKLLESIGVSCVAVDSLARLHTLSADVILVGKDMIDPNPQLQSSLWTRQDAGTRLLIFEQHRAKSLGGYEIVQRKTPANLNWTVGHSLFDQLQPDDLSSWLRQQPELAPLRVPENDPALPLASWARERPGLQPVASDALIVARNSGRGRTVFCQVPLDSWNSDPRSQVLLINAIDYLLSPTERTISPIEPCPPKRAEPSLTCKKTAPNVLQFGTAP